MSDIFHLFALILPWLCDTYRSLKSLCFLSPSGGVFLCKVAALSLGQCVLPLPGLVGAWLGPQPAFRAAGHWQALEQAVPVPSSWP